MTTENIEKKVVETVAENKEAIRNVLTKGVDHKFGIIFGSALGTACVAFAINMISTKVKNKKNSEKTENENTEDIQEVLEKAADALRENDEVNLKKVK